MMRKSMRAATVFTVFIASACAAEGGDDVPSPVDAAEETSPTIDAGRDVTSTDSEPDSGVESGAPDASIDLSWLYPDSFVPWDYNGERFMINIYDARGPDGSCIILPGPWVGLDRSGCDPDDAQCGCYRCLYQDPHPICECIFERYPEQFFPRCDRDH